MAQMGFYYNTDICSGCKVCQIACKDVNNLESGVLFREVRDYESGAFPALKAYNITMACNHCESPACVANCPTDAMYKRQKDGLVLVDKEKCIGCQSCADVCPYKAPKYMADQDKIGKCTMCDGLVEKGEQPACVASCPLRAIECGDVVELRKKYGTNADIIGIANAKLTKPSLIITPHRCLR